MGQSGVRTGAIPTPTMGKPATPDKVAKKLPAPIPAPQPAAPSPRAAPQMVDLGPLDAPRPAPVPVARVSPAPVIYERVEAAPEPVIVAAPAPQMVDVGALDAPQLVYEPVTVAAAPVYIESAPIAQSAPMLTSRVMKPIYDDPDDGYNGPSNAETRAHARKAAYKPSYSRSVSAPPPKVRNNFTPDFAAKLERAAIARLNPGVRYDARYVKIGYPWGDVPKATGVCTDVVIRAYRALGVDLQQLVHEDMRQAFVAYPSRQIYGLRKADSNIDHRRVVNLEAFFERVGAAVPITQNPDDYKPGDIVTWRLSGSEPHIGIVIARRDPSSGNPLVVHNIGSGVKAEDMLFLSRQTGHYRFAPDTSTMLASLAKKQFKTGG